MFSFCNSICDSTPKNNMEENINSISEQIKSISYCNIFPNRIQNDLNRNIDMIESNYHENTVDIKNLIQNSSLNIISENKNEMMNLKNVLVETLHGSTSQHNMFKTLLSNNNMIQALSESIRNLEKSVSMHNADSTKILELEKNIENYVSIVKELNEKDNNKENEINNLHKINLSKVEEIEKLKSVVEKQIQNLLEVKNEKEILESEKEILEFKLNAINDMRNNSRNDSRIKELEKIIEELNQKLVIKNEEINMKTKDVENVLESNNILTLELKKMKGVNNDNLGDVIKALNERINLLEEVLREKDDELLLFQKNSLSELENKISLLNKEKDTIISELKETLGLKIKEITNLQEELSNFRKKYTNEPIPT